VNALILHNLGFIALEAHDFSRARTYLEESLAVARRLNQETQVANGLATSGSWFSPTIAWTRPPHGFARA
jgi:hypothetical protein